LPQYYNPGLGVCQYLFSWDCLFFPGGHGPLGQSGGFPVRIQALANNGHGPLVRAVEILGRGDIKGGPICVPTV